MFDVVAAGCQIVSEAGVLVMVQSVRRYRFVRGPELVMVLAAASDSPQGSGPGAPQVFVGVGDADAADGTPKQCVDVVEAAVR